MPRLFLHVGLPKTGTTYLQNSFEWFEKQGQFKEICYPLPATRESFHDIHSGNGAALGHYLSPRLVPDFIEADMHARVVELLAKVRDSSSDVLLSSEFFATAPAERIERLSAHLAELGYQLEVIVVVRPLSELFFSAYMQCVKRDALDLPFTEWVHFIAERLPGSYIRSIMAYGAKVHVVPYNREALLGRVLDIIGERAELEPHAIQAVVNRSLTRSELDLLWQINRVYKNPHLAATISNALIYRFPERRSARITAAELAAAEAALDRADPPFADYAQAAEQAIVQQYLAPSAAEPVADGNDDVVVDQETLALVLETLHNWQSGMSQPAAQPQPAQEESSEPDPALHSLCRPYVDRLRDLALALEPLSMQAALDIMQFAFYGRPDGPVICNKLDHYRKQLAFQGSGAMAAGDVDALLAPHQAFLASFMDLLQEISPEDAERLAPYIGDPSGTGHRGEGAV